MKINIKGPFTGVVEIDDDSSLLQLRQAIAIKANVDIVRVKLLFSGKVSN